MVIVPSGFKLFSLIQLVPLPVFVGSVPLTILVLVGTQVSSLAQAYSDRFHKNSIYPTISTNSQLSTLTRRYRILSNRT